MRKHEIVLYNMQMMYHKGGIYLSKYFQFTWMIFLILLTDSDIDCYIDNVCVNYVFFGDDLCLSAPCAIAPEQFLNVKQLQC